MVIISVGDSSLEPFHSRLQIFIVQLTSLQLFEWFTPQQPQFSLHWFGGGDLGNFGAHWVPKPEGVESPWPWEPFWAKRTPTQSDRTADTHPMDVIWGYPHQAQEAPLWCTEPKPLSMVKPSANLDPKCFGHGSVSGASCRSSGVRQKRTAVAQLLSAQKFPMLRNPQS